MSALIVYVIGPSGVGKDSLQHWLLQEWTGPGVLTLARRSITRPCATHVGAERHEPLSASAFDKARNAGAFAFDWSANGFEYGIRHTEIDGLHTGDVVLVNGSRAYLTQALNRRPDMAVLSLSASPDVLQQRLTERGRDSPCEILARTTRSSQMPNCTVPLDTPCLHLCNEGDLADTGHKALQWLRSVLTPVPVPSTDASVGLTSGQAATKAPSPTSSTRPTHPTNATAWPMPNGDPTRP